MSEHRDRTRGYVPDGLNATTAASIGEIGRIRDPRNGLHKSTYAPVKLALADALNRGPRKWFWADVSGDGSHWARFNGHHIQVDLRFSTENRREVSGWKGRDEIRGEGQWTLALNRQQCWEGQIGSDPMHTLLQIPRILEQLLNHDAVDWTSGIPASKQLVGRRVYYERTAAWVSRALLEQGCVLLQPAGPEAFPAPIWAMDDPDRMPGDERDEVKTTLLDPKIWWWRQEPITEPPSEQPPAQPCPAEPSA